MKLTGGRIEAFVARPDPKVRVVLVYGPDTGLVRERVDKLTRAVVDDPSDPFRVADLTAATLKEDPSRLADEAAAMALTGGRRVVRLRDAADAVTARVKPFIEDPKGDSLVILQAGDLAKSSSLRKLCEGADIAAALPCYADEGAGLETVVRDTLGAAGLRTSADAMAFLLSHLGGDRQLTRAELEKLVLYKGAAGGEVTLEDAAACVGDSASLGLDDLSNAVADGDVAGTQRMLDRLFREGTNPVQILRMVQRHFQRLHLAVGAVEAGKSPEAAMKSLRPPVFFKVANRFQGQMRRWTVPLIGQALDLLLEAEIDCKSTGLPAEEMCARALMQVARAAGRRR
ncbi:DNA polymerase III delta subunit [Caenispirillum salinarum AK4]|uniref:DNA-directed DNA polymerase n=1 Tax=Caenispirillum salinarum AK4 TaxID=1238182 RepID=K9HPK5_9PROT|nr:DNA polymerase III subunit delta [Caenispirillum salinarum]EKV32188.1 DNA polymerase III delta subunit [Caenispirillum salinarum AK4]